MNQPQDDSEVEYCSDDNISGSVASHSQQSSSASETVKSHHNKCDNPSVQRRVRVQLIEERPPQVRDNEESMSHPKTIEYYMQYRVYT